MRVTRRVRREAKHLFRLCLVDGLLEAPRVRQVAQRLATAGRRECPALLAHFGRLVRLALARRTATIESATPLPAEVQAALEAGLVRRYGPGLTTAVTPRPALIGGLRIQVGSDVYDGSVRAGLAALEQSF